MELSSIDFEDIPHGNVGLDLGLSAASMVQRFLLKNICVAGELEGGDNESLLGSGKDSSAKPQTAKAWYSLAYYQGWL